MCKCDFRKVLCCSCPKESASQSLSPPSPPCLEAMLKCFDTKICFSRRRVSSGVNFTNVFTHSFYAVRSQKRKKLLDLTVFLRVWNMSAWKLLLVSWWNWLHESISPKFYGQLFVQKCFVQFYFTYSLCLLFFGKEKLMKKLLWKCC